jgi:hypothetical protein
MLNLHKKFHHQRINIFIYKNHTTSIFLLKEVIFKHTKITENDQIIFFHGRAHHNRGTQKVSHFYHIPRISYELNKISMQKHFLKRIKSFSVPKSFSHPSIIYPRSLTTGSRGQPRPCTALTEGSPAGTRRNSPTAMGRAPTRPPRPCNLSTVMVERFRARSELICGHGGTAVWSSVAWRCSSLYRP